MKNIFTKLFDLIGKLLGEIVWKFIVAPNAQKWAEETAREIVKNGFNFNDIEVRISKDAFKNLK